MVHLQKANRNPANGGLADYFGVIQKKVIVPVLGTRIEQPDRFASFFVYASEIGAFADITLKTSPC